MVTLASLFQFSFGNIAQLVEQMTFNHWVQGSSPCVPTTGFESLCSHHNKPADFRGIFVVDAKF